MVVVRVGDEAVASSSPTESRLRDEGGKESEALFDFAALGYTILKIKYYARYSFISRR